MHPSFPVYSIGHFINQPDNPTPFEITLFGQMEEPDVEDPHKHGFYEVIWIDAGQSRQIIDYADYCLLPQSLFFISPGQLHFFVEWEHLEGGSVLFTEDFFLLNQQNQDKLFELSFLDNFHAHPLLPLSAEGFAEIRQTIDWLIKEKSRPDYSPSIAQSMLHVLLSQIQRNIDSTRTSAYPKHYVITYKKFKRLIDEHFQYNLSVSAYAERLHLTQHHLNRICKQVCGKTAGEMIRSRSLLEAKRMLTFSDLSVSEIAAQLHIFDPSYFARQFRRETGATPAGFRKSMSEKYRL
jgi:AraC family transcriptional regulator, transcriptional activator of pobA